MTTTLPEDDARPCYGLPGLFDATDIPTHTEAAKLCATCPFINDCLNWYDKTRRAAMESDGHYYYGPSGTWAGRLIDDNGQWIRLCVDCQTPIHAHANIQRCPEHSKRRKYLRAAELRAQKRGAA